MLPDPGRQIDPPGNSVKDTGDRMNGGAVIEERSPDTEASLRMGWMYIEDNGWLNARFNERRPAASLGSGNGLCRN